MTFLYWRRLKFSTQLEKKRIDVLAAGSRTSLMSVLYVCISLPSQGCEKNEYIHRAKTNAHFSLACILM